MPISFLRFLVKVLHLCLNFLTGPPIEGAPSTRFEIGGSSATVPDLVSEVTAFFTRFK